jgi:hypothetical protein
MIGRKGDLSTRIAFSGKDEISSLAGNINGMLDNLEQSRKMQKESETFNLALLNDSPMAIEVLNPDGRLSPGGRLRTFKNIPGNLWTQRKASHLNLNGGS